MTNPFFKTLQKHGLSNVKAAADAATLRGYLDSGNLALNWIMSGKFNGGWPLGHVAELFGDPSTGKSFLIARAIASALSGGGEALLDDTETAFNPVWSSMGLGVDVSRLAYVRPPSHTIEEHYELVMAYIQTMRDLKVEKPSLLALDSLALLSTKHEVESGMDKESMTRAKVIKKHFRLTSQALSDTPTAYLIANHQIANVGDMFNPTTTGGGGGPKYQATIRLQLLKPTKLKDPSGKGYIGVRVVAFVEKNRLVPPWRKAEMIIPFYETISPVSGLVSLLLTLGVLTVSTGHKLIYKEKDTGVAANKSDFWKQDHSALDLLSVVPTLLQELEKTDLTPAKGTEMVEDSTDEED